MRSLLPVAVLLAACSSDATSRAPAQSTSGLARTSASAIGSLPPASAPSMTKPSASVAPTQSPSAAATPDPGVEIVAPPGLGGGKHPFVLFLHGLGGSGTSFATGLGAPALAAEKGFLYAAPDGAVGPKGRFWNASSACCDFEHTGVDHVASLGAIIAAARRMPSVDPARVYVIGFSNGAFMAHRLGCSVPGIRAIVSVAGSAPNEGDPPCKPAAPVAVLEIHGDKDPAVSFDGGHVLKIAEMPAHRSALDTVHLWSQIDGCASGPEERERLDIMPNLEGDETIDLRYSGCKAPVALWRVTGGDHFIAVSKSAFEAIWTYLQAAK